MNSSIKILQFLQKGTLYCCVVVLVLLNSCGLNPLESSLSQVEEELTVELAQKWVERGARIDETDEKMLWDYASKEKVNKKDEAVIVPIAQKNKQDYLSSKHLWVYRDKQKKEQMRYIEYIYDTKKPKNRLQTLKNFTGSMILRAYNGTFLGGLTITDNKIEGLITEFKHGTITEKITSASPNGRTTACFSWTSCRNWHIEIYGAAGVTGTTCLQDFWCWWSTNNGIDPAFTGVVFDIPTSSGAGSGSPAGSAQSNGDWPTGLPTPLKFGFASNPCQGYQIMLAAQAAEGKEIGGIITTEGKVVMFPTILNSVNRINYSFPYFQPNGAIEVDCFLRCPDPADPKYDNQYLPDDVVIQIADFRIRQTFFYKVAGFIHSHPIDGNYGVPQ